MRADALIKVRVGAGTKVAWSAYADRHGLVMSDFVRNACRIAILVGHDRVAEGIDGIVDLRRELHGVAERLRALANGASTASAPELRATLSRVHETADAISSILRGARAR